MTKAKKDDEGRETLEPFAAAARKHEENPGKEGMRTPQSEAEPRDLAADQKDAADIMTGHATGDIARTDAATARRIKAGKGKSPE